MYDTTALDKYGADGIRGEVFDFSEVDEAELPGIEGIPVPKWDGWFTAIVVEGEVGTMYSRGKRYREGLVCKGMEDGLWCGELIENTSWSYKFQGGKFHDKWVAYYCSANPCATPELKLKWLQKHAYPDWAMPVNPMWGVKPDKAFAMCVKDDWEGIVVYRADGTLVKCKKRFERDFVIMGFEQSEAPSYKGKMVKAIVYGDGKKEIGKVGSMDQELRTKFFQEPEKYIGTVFTAGGKGIFESGAMRHPWFVCLREDRPKVAIEKSMGDIMVDALSKDVCDKADDFATVGRCLVVDDKFPEWNKLISEMRYLTVKLKGKEKTND